MMRQLLDTKWQRRGTSWLWDEHARNLICTAGEVWSLRQFLQAVGQWPDVLPSNNEQTMVVAGLDAGLDLLPPDDAQAWLGDTVKEAILSFQHACDHAALVFWLPSGHKRIKVQASTDAVSWLCHGPHGGHPIDFGRVLWGQTNEYPQEIVLSKGDKPAGLFHARIT